MGGGDITSLASFLLTVDIEMTALLSSSKSCSVSCENCSSASSTFSRLATKLGFCTISAKWRAFSKISRLRGESAAMSWAETDWSEVGDRLSPKEEVVVVAVVADTGSFMVRLSGRWEEEEEEEEAEVFMTSAEDEESLAVLPLGTLWVM